MKPQREKVFSPQMLLFTAIHMNLSIVFALKCNITFGSYSLIHFQH